MRHRLVAGVIGLMVLGCAQQETGLEPGQAVEAMNGFLVALMEGDYRTAYDTHLSPGIKFGAQGTYEQFAADMAAVQEKFGPITSARLKGYRRVPGKRVYEVFYEVDHETSGAIPYHLVVEQPRPELPFTVFLVDIGNEQPYPAHDPNSGEIVPPAEPVVLTPEPAVEVEGE